MTRQYQELAKKTVKAVDKMKTKDYVDPASKDHSGAKKVMAMADKPHKAKKAYKLSIKKNIKHSKEDLAKAHKHMKKHGG